MDTARRTDAVAFIRKAAAEDALQYGVKGMRWGVRKTLILDSLKADPEPKIVGTSASLGDKKVGGLQTNGDRRSQRYRRTDGVEYVKYSDGSKDVYMDNETKPIHLKNPRLRNLATTLLDPAYGIIPGAAAFQSNEDGVAFIQKVVTRLDAVQYGVKGMRWGYRRTKAQLAADKPGENSAAPNKTPVKAGSGAKSVKDLSNQELQELVTRLNLEKQLRQLTEKPAKRTKTQKAGKFIADLLLEIGTQEVKRVGGAAARLQTEKSLGKKGKVTREEIAEYLEKQRNKKK